MTHAPIDLPVDASLVDRLARHKTLGGVPRAELEWLAAHGRLKSYGVGEVIVPPGEAVVDMVIMLEGHATIYIDRGSGRRKFMEWHGGDVTGMLPYSRMGRAPGSSVIEEPSVGVVIHKDCFPELIRECPHVTEILVHVMLDRARQFTSTDWQDEKMMSLGKLSAGLAHELNNPASAVARAAKSLEEGLTEMEDAGYALGAMRLADEVYEEIERLRAGSVMSRSTGVFSAIERSDREDELADWLEAHKIDVGAAQALVESGITIEALDNLAAMLQGETLSTAIRWIAAGYTTRSLAADIERASSRIHQLVSAIKRFTHMDRATVSEPASVVQGITDTVFVLSSKAKAKSATVKVDIDDNLPMVRSYGGELNQVWSNLVENALDALDPSGGGEVIVSACRMGDRVVVRVIDNGTGIEPDVQKRIFDPFFTTKPVGEGTGLGLDISQRIVRAHDGSIELDSRPGRTEFRVSFPAVLPAASA
jgi:signal transduction histidine kinase